MKNKKLLVTAFLALVIIVQWLIGPLCEVKPSKLVLHIMRASPDLTMQLTYNTSRASSDNVSTTINLENSQAPVKATFHLIEGAQPSFLKIRMSDAQGYAEISGMDFGYYHWNPTEIKGSFLYNTDREEPRIDGEILRWQATDPETFLSSSGCLDYTYGYLLTRAALIRLAVFLICLLVFFLLVILRVNRKRLDQGEGLKVFQICVFYCSCILLLLPCVFTVLNAANIGSLPVFETAVKKPTAPEFTFKNQGKFLEQVYSYFDTAYAFRDLLIRWNSTWYVRLLNESPIPKDIVGKVIVGKNGWLFIDGSDSLDDHLGMKRLNQQELNSIENRLSQIKNFLDNEGIHFLVVFAPDKETIYPEFLPELVKPVVENTRLDQIIGEIKTIPGLEYIDLRDTLKAAKGPYQLFYRDDSHWNGLGAFIGYREITRWLAARFPQVKSPEIRDVTARDCIHGAELYGLSRMMIMCGEFPDSKVELSRQPQNMGKVKKPSLLIYQDSFYGGMAPYFNEDFATVKAINIREKFDPVLVMRQHPDVVIILGVERGCPNMLLTR